MRTSTKGLLALMNHEGVVLQSYKDSVGVWTIGVGHTAAAGSPKPEPGLKITLKQAVELFRKDIKKYEDGVNRAVKVSLKQHEFDALVSFHYNTGGVSRANLTKKLNDGDRKGAAAGFMGWVKPASIIGRRKKEQKLFAEGDYGNIATVLVYPNVTASGRPTGATAMSTQAILDTYVGKTPGEPTAPATPKRAGGFWPALIAIAIAIAAAFGIIISQGD